MDLSLSYYLDANKIEKQGAVFLRAKGWNVSCDHLYRGGVDDWSNKLIGFITYLYQIH